MYFRYLNISKNYLSGDEVASTLAEILEYDYSRLEELYLRWNHFTASDGKVIFTKILENEELRVLDFSYNSLGKDNEVCCSKV